MNRGAMSLLFQDFCEQLQALAAFRKLQEQFSQRLSGNGDLPVIFHGVILSLSPILFDDLPFEKMWCFGRKQSNFLKVAQQIVPEKRTDSYF